MLTGQNGILKRTTDARERTEVADIIESAKLEILETQVDTEHNGKITNEESKAIIAKYDKDYTETNKDTIKTNEEGKEYITSKSGYEILVSDILVEITTEGNEPVVSIWEYDGDGNITNGTVTLEKGDYVNYNPTAGVTDNNLLIYSSPFSRHGYKSSSTMSDEEAAQTFIASEHNGKWRVLGITEDGMLRIMSADSVTPTGQSSYNMMGWGGVELDERIGELCQICSIYGYGRGAESATSITREDFEEASEGFTPADRAYNMLFKDTNSNDKSYWLSSDYLFANPGEQERGLYGVYNNVLREVPLDYMGSGCSCDWLRGNAGCDSGGFGYLTSEWFPCVVCKIEFKMVEKIA